MLALFDLLTAATTAAAGAPAPHPQPAVPKQTPQYPPVAGKTICKKPKAVRTPVAANTRAARLCGATAASSAPPDAAEASDDEHRGFCEQLVPCLLAETRRAAMTAADVLDIAEQALNEYVRRDGNAGCPVLTELVTRMRANRLAPSLVSNYSYSDVGHFIKCERGARDFELDGNWLRALAWKYTHCIVVLDRDGKAFDIIDAVHQPKIWTLRSS